MSRSRTKNFVASRKALSILAVLACVSWGAATALAQPANDNFASAQALQGPSGTVLGNNDNGSLETGEPVIAGAAGGASIWYAWTAPANGAYGFNTIGSVVTDTVLGIYTGNSVNNLTLVGQNDDIDPNNNVLSSSVTFLARAGTTYYIAIDSLDASQETGDLSLNWGPQQLYGGDFAFTSPLYIFSENEVFNPPLDGFMADAPSLDTRARVTVTRKLGYTGRILVDYTITNSMYTNIFVTNTFGTNIYATNIDLCTGQMFVTNILSTNVAWTNFWQNNEYGQYVYFTLPGAYAINCTNGNLFTTQFVSFCSSNAIPVPTNYLCLNLTAGTNVPGTTTNACGGTNITIYVTNIFCYGTNYTSIVPSADPFIDYIPVSSTVTNDDFQMAVDLPYIFFPHPYFPGDANPPVNHVLIANIDSVYLDPFESLAIQPPTMNLGPVSTLINVLNTSARGGTNVASSGSVASPGDGIIGTNVFNFERSTIRCTESVNGSHRARVWVFRSGAGLNASASVKYRVDWHRINGGTPSANDFFREPPLFNFRNPEIPLQPESDYATPNDVAGFSPSPADYTSVSGTLDFGAFVAGRPIDIPINDDGVVEFNEDFLVQLYLDDSVPVTTASLGYVRDCIVTILFDDQPAGACDSGWNPHNNSGTSPPYNLHPGANATVYAIAMQPDDKAIIGGNFTAYNTTPRNRVARVNVDGSLDTSFNPGSGANDFVSAIALDASNLPLIAGAFSSFNGVQRNGIARLNGNGTLDTSFTPGVGANDIVWAVAAMASGNVVIAGQFTSYNTTNRAYIARLNANGLVDITFDPGAGPNGIIHAIAVQADGKVLIGGEFTSVAGVGRNHVARLNNDGTLDTAFDPGTGADGIIYALVLQADGKVLIGGDFNNVRNNNRKSICRLNADGSLDQTFDPGSGTDDVVYSISVQPDFKIIIGGLFNSYNQTRRIGLARINTDGTVDTTFMDTSYNQFAGVPNPYWDPGFEPHNFIFTTALQSDGMLLVSGNFTRIGGGGARDAVANRSNLARVIGGSTPGPGLIQLAQNSYTADENGQSLFITLQRNNGFLGPASCTFAPKANPPGPGAAIEGTDFTFDAGRYGTPTYIVSYPWPVVSWQLQDGTFGQNQGFSSTVDPNTIMSYLENDVRITLLDNLIVDGNRSLNVELSNPRQADNLFLGGENIATGVGLGRLSAPMTIVDNDTPAGVLGFAITNYTVNESTKFAVITVIRTNGSSGVVTINYQTSDGTATTPADYFAHSGTLTFGGGVTNQTFTVQIVNDSTAEDDETINLVLSNPTGGAAIGLTNAVLTIIDNDSPNGRLNFSSSAYSTNENGGAAIITVNRTGGSQGTLAVYYATSNGTAISGTHYTGVTNTLSWNPGDITPKIFTIPINDNVLVDGDHTVNLRLFSATINGTTNGTVIGSVSNAVLTIVDDDAYGAVAFATSVYNVMENGGPATITVQRTAGIAQAITVNFSTVGGTAIAGTDYTPTNGVLVFAAGEISKSFTVAINNNPFPDQARFIGLSLSNAVPANSLGFPASAILNIVDDETFNEPSGSGDTSLDPATGFNADVYSLALQPNGMILAGGDFTLADDVVRNHIARLYGDGTLDVSFSSPTLGANASVRSVVAQSDGRIVLGGFFTSVNGMTLNRIARLNYNGNLDSSFNPGSGADNNVYAVSETYVGGARKLLLGGAFVNLNGISRSGVGRLNDDGTVDAAFNPGLGANGPVFALVAYPTNSVRAGQVLIGGDFTSVNGVSRSHIARLNANGSLDLSFNPPSGANDSVRAIALQTDEHILIGGLFTNVNGSSLSRIARLNANGTTDSSFNPGVGANDVVSAITLQPDNKILLGGQFTRCSGVTRQRLTRLNSDGSVDPTINFGLGADSFVATVLVQPDDKILLGGGFTHFDGVSQPHITRIYGRSVNGSGTFEFDAPAYTVNENGTNAVVTIRRRGGTSGFPSGNVFITMMTSNGTAIAGINYSNVNVAVAFPPGEVVQSINIPIIDDFIVNADRTVNLRLSNPQPPGGPALGNQASAILTIINDDSAISFSSATYSINEDTTVGGGNIQIIRSGSTVGTATVDFLTTTNGTAVPGVNYTPVSNTVVFAAGQTSAIVQVPVFHDPAPTGDRTVGLILTNAVGSLLLAPLQATLTIIDVEQAPGQFLFITNNFYVGEADGAAPITIIRTNGHSGIVSVHFATANASAIAGVDYTSTNGSLVFGDGETLKTFNIPIIDNNAVQNPRVLSVVLTAPTGGATSGGPTNASVTILDNDPGLTLSAPAYSIGEGAGALTVSVLRLNSSNGPVSISYATTNGTALAGSDYISTTGTLAFANGESLKTFTVPILQDSLVEGDETFTVKIFNVQPPGAAQLVTSSAVVTIIDDDPAIFFASNGVYTVSESGTNITLTVLRTNASALGTNSITFFTSDGSATAGSDYSPRSGSIVFTNGETVKTIVVPILQDTQVEGDETFTVTLVTNTLSGGAQLLTPSVATVTILDDDAGIKFSSADYSVNEGGTVTITVLRTASLTNNVTVNYSTSDGSASNAPPSPDYVATSGTLTFTNGETSKTFTVQTIDDTLIEGNETINLILSNPTGQASVINPQAATLTIIDNDGSLIVAAGSALTAESGPVNGVIDTNETVTLLLALRNSVGTPTTNLIATLLTTNGVTPISPIQQSYGVLTAGGASVSRPFSFTASGTNGGSISAILLLTDGGKTNGLVAFTYSLGTSVTRFTNSAAITINDNTNATPYPSSIYVSGLNGLVSKASITLSNFSHTHPNDVDIMLSAPGGANMLMMGNAGGGFGIQRVNLTFDDSATSYLPQSGQISTGTNKPTAFLPVAPFPAPAPPGPYATNLAACSNSNPNGTWSLYVTDDSPVDTGGITNGWILSITTASVVPAAADLVVSMTGSADPIVQNSNLTYTISVTNYGPSAATQLMLTNVLPASAAFVSASIGGYTLAGNVLTFTNLGTLAKDGWLSFTVTVQAVNTGTLVSSATVTAAENDPYTTDNTASVSTTVLPPSADLILTMSDAPDPVTIGANLVYTLTVSNGGPATASGLRLTNTLPASVTFVSATPSGYSVVGNVITFTNLPDLGSGLQLTATITVHPTAAGNITNNAIVSSTVLDPLKANNSASVKTVVEAVALSVTRSGPNVIISWPASATSYVLESASALNPPISWTQVTTPPSQVVGDQRMVTVGVTNANRFFRLRAPAP